MELKLESGVKIKIKRNPLNKGMNPIGRFSNIEYVWHNDQWYRCYITINKNSLKIQSLYKATEGSSVMKDIQKDVIYHSEVSKFKKELILFLLGRHKLNSRIFNVKRFSSNYRAKIWVFLITLLLSATYYYGNIMTGNQLMDIVATNVFVQTVFLFLALAGFINIFFPFTVRDELSKTDAEKIAHESFIKKRQEEEDDRRSEAISTL